VHSELTDGQERLRIRYLSSVEIDEEKRNEKIGKIFQAQLEAQRQREIAAGMTLSGPHRDEVRFFIDKVDAGIYGSRGQQRTVALALKLAEVQLMQKETGEFPVLLLDDVLSELDAHRRRFLLGRLDDGPQQALITTTDLHSLPGGFVGTCQLWRVKAGRLTFGHKCLRDGGGIIG
jgi:DNA replication and repair protein RecF